ncbi:Sgd1 protein [Saccharomycopsis crataegensis]|uniref:Sgd1 protein n=1 Tax=Saccharomycopsis crataegensis TaxID=43959 RepID=A0AAV5QSF9_9ASCO|nr:Sgd1 protein [Saccharomycopsis crataegensis]
MKEKHGIRLPGVLLDEIRSKEDAGGLPDRKFKNGLNKRKASRRDLRKEKRTLKKQKQNHSKVSSTSKEEEKSKPKLTSSLKNKETSLKSSFRDSSASKKKSVVFDESLNTTKSVKPAYKKSDFFDEEDMGDEDSDLDENPPNAKKERPKTSKEIMEELNGFNQDKHGDEDFSDFSGDSDEMSDLEGPDQPQTPSEVFAALQRAKMNKSSKPPKKQAPEPPKAKTKAKAKTAKEIMEELNGKNDNVEEEEEDFSDFSGDSDEMSDLEGPDQPQTAEEVFAALKRAKMGNVETGKKSTKKSEQPKKETKTKTAKEIMEELGGKNHKQEDYDDDFSDFSGDSDEMSDLEGPDQPQTAEEVFVALKKAKMGVNSATKKPEPKKEKSKKEKKLSIPAFLQDDLRRDEEEMKFYAKKLGLKDMKLSKADDDDFIGGLFDGLDFMNDYGAGEDGGEDEGEYDDESGEDDDDIPEEPKIKENPYVAPTSAIEEKPKKYIPPALRKLQLSEDEQERLKIQRAIKGQLNKLSEVNILVIANEINSLYFDNSRHLVNETLTKTILESIYLQTKLLDSFVVLHAALVAAMYRLQGTEFLVHFIQSLVENYEKYYESNLENKKKESSNLLSLLTFCYTLQVVNCNLIYDIIKVLIGNFNEYNSELLLRMINNTGSQLRSDDPSALKEIVLMMYENTKGKKLTPRMEFLIESIEDLKNNKMNKRRNEVTENNYQLIIKMKKFLGSINNNKNHDPLTVTLDDLHNIDKRGKWWLTGSAWKGREPESKSEQMTSGTVDDETIFENLNAEAIDDIIDSSEPNWLELARAYRMNNDIRRAIFISIMSSDDYIDAFTKLDKLQLKRSQQKDIPSILLHCQQLEPGFNKFYALLAGKLCSEHLYRKTLQFCLWNLIKELNGDDDDGDSDSDDGNVFKSQIKSSIDNEVESEDIKLQKLINSAKFFGFLMGIGSLQLNLFRVVNFLTINEDTRLFLEITFITFFEEVIKKSEPEGGNKKKSDSFNDKILNQRFDKISDPVLIKGIQLFLRKRVKNSSFVKNKYKKKISWAIDAICDIKSDGDDGADEY